MAKFSEGVLTAVDGDGYPVSVRQLALPYDAASGSMPVVLPEGLEAVPGSASLLCHFHDEKLWNLRAILLKGRIERRERAWTFVTTEFTPPSTWSMMKNVRRSTKRYLDKRGLPAPVVNYAVIEEMWKRARKIRDP